MADKVLKVDDEYCIAMAEFFTKEGAELEGYLDRYISILRSIKSEAWIKGHGAEGLNSYIEYASRLKGQIDDIASSAASQARSFVENVDIADKYLY